MADAQSFLASSAIAVTPSDTVGFAVTNAGVWVGGAGNMVCVMEDGRTATFTGVTAGSLLPIRVTRVNSTSTTATSILALRV